MWDYCKWEYGMLLKYKLFHWLSGYITLDIGISILSGHFSSLIGNFLQYTSLPNWLNVLNQKAPLSEPKSAKKSPKFFSQKTPQFWSKEPQFKILSKCHCVENAFLFHFYVTISPKISYFNIFPTFFIHPLEKSCF